MQSLSIFVFAYNEAQSLEVVTKEIVGTLAGIGRPYEVVIIDDGSTDGTSEIADRLAQQLTGVSVIHHDRNYGLGSVYMTAFNNAHCDLITFFFADGQFSPEIIKQFLPAMDEYDIVLGYLSKRKDSLMARILSKAEKILLKILFGPMPKFQGVLMFKRRLLEELELKSDGGRAWTILMELIIRASRGGYKVTSVPIEIRPRLSGKSKVRNLSTILANLRQAFILKRYI